MGPFGPKNLEKCLGLSVPRQGTSQYLFLRCDALLVPLPPGWVMQVAKCLVSSCDS